MALALWQLYDAQQRPLEKGAAKHEVAVKGLLHGAAHVWIWRQTKQGVEILLQQRASAKVNWPKLFDKSAGGHIFLGETPELAVSRKTKQELGLVLAPEALLLVGEKHWHAAIGDTGLTENEYQWIYTTHIDSPALHLNNSEVASVLWKALADFKADIADSNLLQRYVPYGEEYYRLVCQAIEQAIES